MQTPGNFKRIATQTPLPPLVVAGCQLLNPLESSTLPQLSLVLLGVGAMSSAAAAGATIEPCPSSLNLCDTMPIIYGTNARHIWWKISVVGYMDPYGYSSKPFQGDLCP